MATESIPNQARPPGVHLKKVLKSYQAAAVSSLSGPGTFMSSWSTSSDESPSTEVVTSSDDDELDVSAGNSNSQSDIATSKGSPDEVQGEYDPFLAPPPFPIQQMPIFTPADQTRSERIDTVLEEETITSFVVGGEKRLCLPQILNTVLRDFSLQQINLICDELHIFCSRCNQEQLHELKVAGILPASAPSCGLITKTDAERLCNALLHQNPPKVPDVITSERHRKLTSFSLQVFHSCFGKCKGFIYPDLYVSPTSLAIECCDCHGLFTPEQFVCHAHKSLENRTCHWGFDSHNWRAYLLLVKDQENVADLQKYLDDVKARFNYDPITAKRKKGEEVQGYIKKVKSEYEDKNGSLLKPQNGSTQYWCAPQGIDPWVSSINWAVYSNWVEKQRQITSQLIQSTMIKQGSNSNSVKLPSYIESQPPFLLKPSSQSDLSTYKYSESHQQHKITEKSSNAHLNQSYPKKPFYNELNKIDHLKDDKCHEIDLSVHSDDSSCSTVTAADLDCETKDAEVNKQIEEIRMMLEAQKIEDSVVDSVMNRVLKIKSIYVNKLIQITYDSEELSKSTSTTVKNSPTQPADVNPKFVDNNHLMIKSEAIKCIN